MTMNKLRLAIIWNLPFVFLIVYSFQISSLHLDELGASPLMIDDNVFSKSNNRQEYEANLFTPQILIADGEVLPYIYEDTPNWRKLWHSVLTRF